MAKKQKVPHNSVQSCTVPFLSAALGDQNHTTISSIAKGNATLCFIAVNKHFFSKVSSSDCVVINFDDIFNKVEKLESENAKYKTEIESLEARNLALQIALITATKSPAKPMFTEEVSLILKTKILKLRF